MNKVSTTKRSLHVAHPTVRREGVALVLILGFLVLLSGLTLAFFSRAMIERQVSNSSAAQAKADLLALSAADVVVGNLKQEIVLGSTAATVSPTPTSGATSATIYTPNSNVYIAPLRFGTPAPAGNPAVPVIANLVRYSMHGDTTSTPTPAPNASPSTGPVPFVSSLASNVNSTNNPSANGRAVGLARWNSHYLIPRLNPSSTSIDSTPIANFTPPDWVMVTSSGPKVLTAPDSTTIGRYAYAIYDEGGLLDANAAGYPVPSSTPSGSPYPTLKGTIAFADLTQLPTTGTSTVPAAQVNNLVGWRNYATTQPGGTLSTNYTFDSPATLRYYNYILGLNTTPVGITPNFLTANPSPAPAPATPTSRTDQIFTSRQALLKFRRATGLSQNALQYLGTFSRDLEQPSYVPNPARPRVQNSYNISTAPAPFGTGNFAYNTDTGAAQTNINPPFPMVTVAKQYQRLDGTTAMVGDPLVNKRFPLNRLSYITSTKTNSESQTDSTKIYPNFGLYRSSASSNWTYSHGNDSKILRLDDVKSLATPRDPDFFELLKAAINVGSVGKSACLNYNSYKWTDTNSNGNLQHARDTLTDLQILQIGANIIDQSKADNFPTRIQFAGLPNYEVRGVEDLPYLYCWRNWVMRTGQNSGVLLWQPELWNPHDMGSSTGVKAVSTPTKFRFRVARDATTTTATPIGLNAYYNTAQGTAVPWYTNVTVNSPSTLPAPVTFSAGELNGFWGFREPTLLGQANVPANSYANCSPNYTDYPPLGRQMIGLTVATFQWLNPNNTTPTQSTDTLTQLREGFDAVNSSNKATCIRFFLDYQDSSGNWIPYDEQVTQLDNNETNNMTTKGTITAFPSNQEWWGGARTDPRTSRWGMRITEYIQDLPVINASTSTYSTFRPDTGIGYGNHTGGYADGGIYGQSTYSSPDQYQGIQNCYWSENSTRSTFQTDGGNGLRFIVDPDGVPRRTMGGYSTDMANGGKRPSATTGSLTGTVLGLPLVTSNNLNPPESPLEYKSRPTILHRLFQSVGELGYVFRDTPWGNIDFSFPESGDTALLDVFCINENTDPKGLVAGRVNLNTQQAPVIQALVANTLRDKDDSTNPVITQAMASALGTQLVARTMNVNNSSTLGPLVNRADLVGTSNFSGANGTAAATSLSTALQGATMDPNNFYYGFSSDIGTLPAFQTTATLPASLIPRQREAAIRALADVGTTRVWNLMIDVVAQSGRYPTNATALSNFNVDGEKRYWLHVAIDRFTGKVLDKQLELVDE